MSDSFVNDWITPTLTDIVTFLSANGLHEGAAAVAKAADVVTGGNSASPYFELPAPVTTEPVIRGSVIQFCVYSRARDTAK
jgi:hypothetical protein